ncbi:unnamed protein product [Bemisia tabaci]|uniref:DNA repair protein REV1 n=1 Tax=Bemisia tabaci TaxID=7038 RepID=A0A9P0AA02_BEMTA|nr:unnamed protein product [Bemisia tabaci]
MRRRTYPLNVNNGFEDWGGYMNAKKQKLEEQFAVDANKEAPNDKSTIFQGIAIFVNGYTVPSAEELKFLMMEHGGIYHHYQSPRTTHIIASNLPDTKIKQLKGNLKIVKPEWIVDSLKANRLLGYDQYLLYTNQSTTQPTLKFTKTSPVKNKTDLPNGFNGSTSPGDLFEDCEAMDCASEVQNEKKSEISPTKQSKWTARTASDDNFLSEFYQNSRLHHIATMGATFKDYVNELREKNSRSFPGRKFLNNVEKVDLEEDELDDSQSKNSQKTIMHIDMDCFFVSVGLRNHPELRGVPVAVTHSKKNPSKLEPNQSVQKEIDLYKKRTIERYKKDGDGNDDLIAKRISWANNIGEADSMSEIASCSYEARKLGVKNGMFLGQALKLCPNLKTIQYDFEGYKEVSTTLYNCVASFTLDIEAVSCDEMFVDCTSLLKETGVTALQFATVLRGQIKEKTGCPCSTGFGSNKLLARLATRKAKPDGQFYLSENNLHGIMRSLLVADLPGVGRAMVYKLSTLGVKTCADLERIPLDKLKSEFGEKTGLSLYNNCRGKDDQVLNFNHQRKSVSAEINYGIRFKDQAEADNFLQKLSKEVENRLREVKMKGRCITLKFMVRAQEAPTETAKFMGHGVCDHMTKSVTIPIPTADSNIIYKEVMKIAQQWKAPPQDLRGIGIQVSRLQKEIQVAKSSLYGFLKRNSLSQKMRQKDKGNTPSNNSSTPKLPTSEKHDSHQNGEQIDIDFGDQPPDPLHVNDLTFKKPNSCHEEEPMVIDFDNPQPGPSQVNGFKKTFKPSVDEFFNRNKQNTKKPPAIDNSVLEALPDDIRIEVLKEYPDQIKTFQQLEKTKPPKIDNTESQSNLAVYEADLTLSQVDKSFLEALPNDLRQEVISDFKSRASEKKAAEQSRTMIGVGEKSDAVPTSTSKVTDDDDAEELDFSLSIKEIRKLIKEWTQSEEKPTEFDINIFSKYLVHLACSKDLEHLLQILNMLYRLLAVKKEISWKRAYSVMVEAVQGAMMQTYNSKLMVNEFFPP